MQSNNFFQQHLMLQRPGSSPKSRKQREQHYMQDVPQRPQNIKNYQFSQKQSDALEEDLVNLYANDSHYDVDIYSRSKLKTNDRKSNSSYNLNDKIQYSNDKNQQSNDKNQQLIQCSSNKFLNKQTINHKDISSNNKNRPLTAVNTVKSIKAIYQKQGNQIIKLPQNDNSVRSTTISPKQQSPKSNTDLIKQDVDNILQKIQQKNLKIINNDKYYNIRPSSLTKQGGKQPEYNYIIQKKNLLLKQMRTDSPSSRLDNVADQLLMKQVKQYLETIEEKQVETPNEKKQTKLQINQQKITSHENKLPNPLIKDIPQIQGQKKPSVLKLQHAESEKIQPLKLLYRPQTSNPYSANSKAEKAILMKANIEKKKENLDKILGQNFYKSNSNLDRYKLGDIIGKGSYAVVKLAEDTYTNKKVAIKTYDKFRLIDPQRRMNVKREIEILQKTDHHNIIKMYELIENKHTVNLIMEYVGSTCLKQYLKSLPNRRMDEKKAQIIFQQIVSGVGYCHDHNIIHRDIKLENILIESETMIIKIIDFGFSVKVSSDKKLNIFCGTPSYMAPEIVKKTEYFGKSADIWSLGILLYVMLFGKFPFRGKDDNDLYRQIQKCEFKINNTISQEAKSLIQSILILKWDERINCQQILKHSWLEGIKINKLFCL